MQLSLPLGRDRATEDLAGAYNGYHEQKCRWLYKKKKTCFLSRTYVLNHFCYRRRTGQCAGSETRLSLSGRDGYLGEWP